MDGRTIARRLAKDGYDVSDVHIYHTVYLTLTVNGNQQQVEAKFSEQSWSYNAIHEGLAKRLKEFKKELHTTKTNSEGGEAKDV